MAKTKAIINKQVLFLELPLASDKQITAATIFADAFGLKVTFQLRLEQGREQAMQIVMEQK